MENGKLFFNEPLALALQVLLDASCLMDVDS